MKGYPKFNQAVRVRSIVIHSLAKSQAPRVIKILVNRPNLGFEDVEDAVEPEVTQVLTISDAIVAEGKPIALRFVRFQAVNSLHVRCHHILPISELISSKDLHRF
jgi:PITH domain